MTMLNVYLRRNGCQSAGSWKWKEIKGEAEARRPGGRVWRKTGNDWGLKKEIKGEAEARRPGGRMWRKTGNDWGLTGGMCRTMLDRVVVFLGTVQPARVLKEPCAYGQGKNG